MCQTREISVEALREYAKQHYNEGGDVVYECWDDQDLQEVIDDCEDPFAELDLMFRINKDREKEGF
jgi:hypothetical protein